VRCRSEDERDLKREGECEMLKWGQRGGVVVDLRGIRRGRSEWKPRAACARACGKNGRAVGGGRGGGWWWWLGLVGLWSVGELGGVQPASDGQDSPVKAMNWC